MVMMTVRINGPLVLERSFALSLYLKCIPSSLWGWYHKQLERSKFESEKNQNAHLNSTLQLDKGDEESELDLAELDEGEPDFYTQAHMPY